MTDAVAAGSARIGTYALEVGTLAESYAAFEPQPEDRNVNALRDALAEEAGGVRTPIAVVEKLQANVETVTRRCERAQELSWAAAEGQLFEAAAVIAEVDSLLRLAERLDRDGRFDEELRLLRALHGLLVLARRWLDLIRGLRRALSAAVEAGDLAAQAWVRHELGSLHLCADEPEAAAEHLAQAFRLQQRLGQATGTCATRHNLDSAQRDLATRAASTPRSRRRMLRLGAIGGVLTLLAGGGTAIARSQREEPPPPGPPATTTTETNETTTRTTTPTTAPTAETTTPSRETIETTTPTTTPSRETIETTTPTTTPSRETIETTTPTTATIDATAPVLTLACDDEFDTHTLTIGCTLASTDAGTASFEFTETQFLLRQQIEVENVVEGAQPVDLEQEAPPVSLKLTLPHKDFNQGLAEIRSFVVVAVQSDAAGNSGRSAGEKAVPFSIE